MIISIQRIFLFLKWNKKYKILKAIWVSDLLGSYSGTEPGKFSVGEN